MIKSYGSILFTDIVGSSKQWASNPVAMKQNIDAHFKNVLKLSKMYKGIVVKNIGDAFMVFFQGKHSLKRAISFSIELIKIEVLQLRIGICEGIVDVKKYTLQNCLMNDYFGTTVNTASRMESKIATPGSIAFGIIPSNNKFATNVTDILERIVHFHTIQYVKDIDLNKCKSNFKLLSRSGRMLTGQHVLICKSVEELHGVPPIKVYTIHVNH